MTLFWIIAALLIAGALLFVLPPLLRRGLKDSTTTEPNNALNIAVYRDQLNELEADRRAGTLKDEQYERARLELERRLLDDVAADKAPAWVERTTSRADASTGNQPDGRGGAQAGSSPSLRGFETVAAQPPQPPAATASAR